MNLQFINKHSLHRYIMKGQISNFNQLLKMYFYLNSNYLHFEGKWWKKVKSFASKQLVKNSNDLNEFSDQCLILAYFNGNQFYCFKLGFQVLFDYATLRNVIFPTDFKRLFLFSISSLSPRFLKKLNCSSAGSFSSPWVASVHRIQFFNIVTSEIQFLLCLGQ